MAQPKLSEKILKGIPHRSNLSLGELHELILIGLTIELYGFLDILLALLRRSHPARCSRGAMAHRRCTHPLLAALKRRLVSYTYPYAVWLF
jgi:hypothetical protein